MLGAVVPRMQNAVVEGLTDITTGMVISPEKIHRMFKRIQRAATKRLEGLHHLSYEDRLV